MSDYVKKWKGNEQQQSNNKEFDQWLPKAKRMHLLCTDVPFKFLIVLDLKLCQEVS